MNSKEMSAILAKIQYSYPNWHPENKAAMLQTWLDFFQDYPASTVGAAVMAYIASDTKGFAPAVGQIIDIIARGAEANDMTAEEAWSQVRRAISRGIYYAEEDYAKLPPVSQRAIGSADNIRALATSTSAKIDSVEKSHFIRAYETILERDRETRKLPENIRRTLGLTVTEPKMLTDATEAAQDAPDEDTQTSIRPETEKLLQATLEQLRGKQSAHAS